MSQITKSLDADALILSRQLGHNRKRRSKLVDSCYATIMESFLQDAEVCMFVCMYVKASIMCMELKLKLNSLCI